MFFDRSRRVSQRAVGHFNGCCRKTWNEIDKSPAVADCFATHALTASPQKPQCLCSKILFLLHQNSLYPGPLLRERRSLWSGGACSPPHIFRQTRQAKGTRRLFHSMLLRRRLRHSMLLRCRPRRRRPPRRCHPSRRSLHRCHPSRRSLHRCHLSRRSLHRCHPSRRSYHHCRRCRRCPPPAAAATPRSRRRFHCYRGRRKPLVNLFLWWCQRCHHR